MTRRAKAAGAESWRRAGTFRKRNAIKKGRRDRGARTTTEGGRTA